MNVTMTFLSGFAMGVALLCCAAAGKAQAVSFLRYVDVPIGPGCCRIASADFNGDGRVDLVVSSDSGLALLPGNGDGSFKPKIDLLPRGILVAVADINRDGKPDLVVDDLGVGLVLLGKGDGTFQPAKAMPYGGVIAGDLNGDGFPDLFSGSDNQPCFFVVHLGNGDGTFQKPLGCGGSPPEGDFSANITFSDLNGDGKLDLVWANVRSTFFVYLWLGNGDGTFQLPSQVAANPNSYHGGKPIAIGDLNHDGKPDLAVGNGAGVAVVLGKGDGTFQPPVMIQAPDGTVNTFFVGRWSGGNGIFIRDFDGDGNPDIALDDFIVRGNGDGTFQPPQFFLAGPPYSPSVICADLNGDGKPDLVYLRADPITGGLGTGLSVLLNNTGNSLPTSVLGYSAATGGARLAPSSIGSIYGTSLARVTAQASGTNQPTELGGVSLRIRDSSDTVRLAPLIFVSPNQINFLVPAETRIGPMTINIDDGSTPFLEGANATVVTDLAPGFFKMNQQGLAAATAVRVWADGTQEAVAVFSCTSPGQCNAVPIDLGSALPVYLSLYGTGLRNANRNPGVLGFASCQVGGKDATVQFFGPQPLYPGLDQLNLLLPQSLPSGQASVQCRFAGDPATSTSNVVQIAIR